MNSPSISDIPSDVVRRITVAADQLYEDSGRISFPNVDAVRRKARVNMNDVSNVMKVWRRAQTAVAPPLTASIPSPVQEASQAMLATVWNAATNSANANLQAAQAGWEQERAEAEACRHQLATAFDSQTEELGAAQRHAEALVHKLAVQDTELQVATASLEKLRKEVTEAEGWAATAEARANEIMKRTEDLKAELARAHANADHDRSESKSRIEAADTTTAILREALRLKTEAENNAREELAGLRGQVDAMAKEYRDLLATLKPNGNDRPPAKPRITQKAKSPNGG
jgi:colicin import membrane protein